MTSTSSEKFDRRPPPPFNSAISTVTASVLQPDGARTLAIKVPGRDSPKASWEETLNDLSRGLQLICGSPPNASPMSPRSNYPLTSPGPFTYGDTASSSPLTSTPPKATLRTHAGELRRADSVQDQGSRSSQRPIFVRHIETHAVLQTRLVEICRTGPTPDVLRRTQSPYPSAVHTQSKDTSIIRPIDRNGVCIRVNDVAFSAEELIVSVRKKCHLAVETISGKILHKTTLSKEAQTRHLVGNLSEKGFFVIREKPTNMADSMFNGTGSAFIPVLKQDESKLELTISLHVPKHFRFEDISVKTVDDHLIVVGKKRAESLPEGESFNAKPNSSVLPTFRVMIRLPNGTDSRSVSASLTRHHQLIIRGKLGPISRRYTF